MNSKIYLGSTSKAMAEREKEAKTKIQTFEYLKNEKGFLNEIKNIFLEFLKGYHLVKKKIA